MKARAVIIMYLVSKTFWGKFPRPRLFFVSQSFLWVLDQRGKGCFYCSDFGRGKPCFSVFLQKFIESPLIILKALQLRRLRFSLIFAIYSLTLRIGLLCIFHVLFVKMTLHWNCNSQHPRALNLSSVATQSGKVSGDNVKDRRLYSLLLTLHICHVISCLTPAAEKLNFIYYSDVWMWRQVTFTVDYGSTKGTYPWWLKSHVQ